MTLIAPDKLALSKNLKANSLVARNAASVPMSSNLTSGARLGRYEIKSQLGVGGNRTGAESMLEELNELSKKRYVSSLEIARIHLALGEKNEVFECFNKAVDEREGWLIWVKLEPSFDNLRSD